MNLSSKTQAVIVWSALTASSIGLNIGFGVRASKDIESAENAPNAKVLLNEVEASLGSLGVTELTHQMSLAEGTLPHGFVSLLRPNKLAGDLLQLRADLQRSIELGVHNDADVLKDLRRRLKDSYQASGPLYPVSVLNSVVRCTF